MPVAANLLQRFRPAGAPGSATPAGVPDDVADRRAAELAPVFAALAPVQSELATVVSGAEAEAGRRVHAAAERAAALRAEMSPGSEVLRADLLARARAQADAEARRSVADARRRAERIAMRARESLDSDVATVVDRVRLRVVAELPGERG